MDTEDIKSNKSIFEELKQKDQSSLLSLNSIAKVINSIPIQRDIPSPRPMSPLFHSTH